MTRAIPKPCTTIAGKNVVQYEPCPAPGTTNMRKPAAAESEAATSGTFVPKRATTFPETRPSKSAMATNGRNTLPATRAEYPCTCIIRNGRKYKEPVSPI